MLKFEYKKSGLHKGRKVFCVILESWWISQLVTAAAVTSHQEKVSIDAE